MTSLFLSWIPSLAEKKINFSDSSADATFLASPCASKINVSPDGEWPKGEIRTIALFKQIFNSGKLINRAFQCVGNQFHL